MLLSFTLPRVTSQDFVRECERMIGGEFTEYLLNIVPRIEKVRHVLTGHCTLHIAL